MQQNTGPRYNGLFNITKIEQKGCLESETYEATEKRSKTTEVENYVVHIEIQNRDRSYEDSDDRSMGVPVVHQKEQSSVWADLKKRKKDIMNFKSSLVNRKPWCYKEETKGCDGWWD